jgi:V-type H+-transporting ATPase subunit a
MMFGDMGHGSVILLFGLFLTLGEPWLKNNSAWKMMVPMRYLFLFMGMSATFCGFCYNEFFSLPLNLFSSCYNLD